MIIIWRRWGPLGLVFLVFGFLVWVAISATIRNALELTATTGWWNVAGLVVGFSVGAIANWLFAVKVVEPRLDKPHADPRPPSSTLFFLPLRYWSWAIVAIGVVFLVPNVIAVATR